MFLACMSGRRAINVDDVLRVLHVSMFYLSLILNCLISIDALGKYYISHYSKLL